MYAEAEKQDGANYGVVDRQDERWWHRLIDEEHPLVVYRFTTAPMTKGSDWIGCTGAFLVSAKLNEIPFISVESNGLMLVTYGPRYSNIVVPPARVGARALGLQQFGGSWVRPQMGQQFSVLETFRNSIFVAPHRVVNTQMPLITKEGLSEGGSELAQFLHTLHSNEQKKFEKIQSFVIGVFAQFESVNTRSRSNQVQLTLTLKGTETEVPLDRCGTGVEQMLTLATQVVTSKPGTLILLDEPHSFLHPDAERKLMQFLSEHQDKQFVIATHSAVMMNAVTAASIVHIEPPGCPYSEFRPAASSAKLLLGLGYRNSDVLFHDRLIIGEGITEQGVLPLLLKACEFSARELDRTGFPALGGVPEGSREQQTAVLRFEKLLATVGRKKQPRIYLFDLDRSGDDQKLLRGTRPEGETDPLPIKFLPRMELENYLLVPEAIAKALCEEAEGVAPANLERDVETILERLKSDCDDTKLFPMGKPHAPEQQIKGGRALERIYDELGAGNYSKTGTGRLIARHITMANQPALTELKELFAPFFDSKEVAKAAK